MLQNLLQNGASCDFWRAAVTGDERTVCHCINVLFCPIPLHDCFEQLPDRMWYWQFPLFVELGQTALKQQGRDAQSQKLGRCLTELRRAETEWVDGIVRYLCTLPEEHVDRVA